MTSEATGRTAELIQQLELSNAELRAELALSEDARDKQALKLDTMIDSNTKLQKQIADLIATKGMYDAEQARRYSDWKAQMDDVQRAKDAGDVKIYALRQAILQTFDLVGGVSPPADMIVLCELPHDVRAEIEKHKREIRALKADNDRLRAALLEQSDSGCGSLPGSIVDDQLEEVRHGN